jgi:thiamine-monophosphate kinase
VFSSAYAASRNEGRALAPVVTAMMDVSDGLLIDAARLAEASGGTLALDSAAVPIAAPEARRGDVLRWGDDYELLFALPPGVEPAVPATRIGAVRDKGDVPLLLDDAPPEGPLGYEHNYSGEQSTPRCARIGFIS